MKKLTTLLTLFITLSVLGLPTQLFGQSVLEISVFKKINEYRKKNGLKELVWDSVTYKASTQHSKYMVGVDQLTHVENNPTPTSGKRLTKYGVTWKYNAENCLLIYVDNTEKESVDGMSSRILQTMIESPLHNKTLLEPVKYSYGAISCVDIVKASYFSGGNGIYVTLNVYGKK